MGNDSVSDAEGGLSLGSNNVLESTATDSVLLGNKASAKGRNSVALGSGSVADADNVISVGSDTMKRRITNIESGTLSETSTDAVTGSQLYATNKRVETVEDTLKAKADTDASNIDIGKWAEKLGTGKVEDGNSNLVTGGTVYRAIESYNTENAIASYDATNSELRIGASAKYDNADVINVSKSDGSARAITGIATNANDPTSAANVGYVNAVGQNMIDHMNDGFTRINDRINKVGAGAAAMASLVPGSFEEDSKWNISASVGNYRSSTAGAVGAFYKPTGNVTIAVKGAFGNGENMVGGGIGVALNKGSMPGVTKAQLVRTVNAQAQKIQTMEATHNAQISELKAQMDAMAKELAATRQSIAKANS